MIEKKIEFGKVEFTSNVEGNKDPYLIGVFADEHCGKTRFGLTGPSGVGCIVTEMKAYITLDKDSKELGKRIFKPKDPYALMVNARKVLMLENDIKRQMYYKDVVARIEDATFAMLESKDVSVIMVDKFTHYCMWKEFAINGIGENFVKIDGRLVQRKAEVVQGIIDFLSSLSQYGKPVLLLCSAKPDFEVLGPDKKPLRNTWNAGGFYYLGSHTNLMVELFDNKKWDPSKANGDNAMKNWHYGLNVRRCQKNPGLEGPEGQQVLTDDMITLPNLVSMVDPEADLEAWL